MPPQDVFSLDTPASPVSSRTHREVALSQATNFSVTGQINGITGVRRRVTA